MSDEAPILVIVGRPNVGKSLLFNRLLGRRAALVHDKPGMTLDFLSEDFCLPDGRTVHLVDTGGVMGEEDDWTVLVKKQMKLAVERADILLFVTDARIGPHPGDEELLRFLRRCRPDTPRLLAVNKAEGLSFPEADFYALGEEKILPVSAKRGSGVAALLMAVQRMMVHAPTEENEDALPVAVVGRPNVGKSTLINCMLGDERLVVSERAGTTRDAVRVKWQTAQGCFALIDTAGMRRRRAEGSRECLSVAAAHMALQDAEVAFLVVDLAHGITRQDKRIIGLIDKAGCAVVLLANKSDLLAASQRRKKLKDILDELPFVSPVSGFVVSALQDGLPFLAMLKAAKTAAAAGRMTMPTARLNKTLEKAIAGRSPPRVGGIIPKLRYAHQGGRRPLSVVVHGSSVIDKIGDDYRRYLSASFAREFSLVGAPLKVFLRAEENPYV